MRDSEVPLDVHQHVWGPCLVDALRSRTRPPRLDSWTLHIDGEPPYQVDPADHDLATRLAPHGAAERGIPARAWGGAGDPRPGRTRQEETAGTPRALVSLSSPLGIEWLPPEEATPLIDAYHKDALALPRPFGAWAAACVSEVDTDVPLLDFAGLQLPANALLDADGYDRCAPLLKRLESLGKPLFIHPGAVGSPAAGPGWWPALVPYVQQMHAAWYAFRAFGRPRHPRLRVCFALLAGLAPLHGERLAARGGGRVEVDPDAFVETSSYGSRAVDAVVRAIGIDVVVHGSDLPYAQPCADYGLGDAAQHAITITNPRRLIHGEDCSGSASDRGRSLREPAGTSFAEQSESSVTRRKERS